MKKKKKFTIKKTAIILTILGVVACVLLIRYCSDTPKFSRDTRGYDRDRDDRHSPWRELPNFHENIYVRNFPKDSLEQLKLMLSYADKITLGFQTPRKMRNKTENLRGYTLWFLNMEKQEDETFLSWFERKIFTEQCFGSSLIGHVSFHRCDDTAKWRLRVAQKYQTESINGEIIGGSFNIDIFDECYPVNKENLDGLRLELVNYYENLQNKRNKK